jgi:tetratricopeptide (TPR) repeat protein/O-antigen ligase
MSLIWSSDVAVASRDFGYHLAMYALFLAAFLYGREEERVDNLLHFPIAAGVLAGGFGLLQYYEIDAVLFKMPQLSAGRLLGIAGLALTGAGLTRVSPGSLAQGVRAMMIGLALLCGVAAGFKGGEVYALGLIVVCLWVFLRSLSPSAQPLPLLLRALIGFILFLSSGLVDPQLMLLLGAAILLDEASESRDKELGTLLLGIGVLAAAITAGMRQWDLAFLVLPKKPGEAVKIYSFMGHRNYLAGFLIAVLPLTVVRLLAVWCVVPAGERRWSLGRIWKAGVYLAAVTLMAVVIVLCQTRGAWIGGVSSLCFLSTWLLIKYRPLKPFGLLAMSVGIVTLVVFSFGWKRLEIPGWGTISNPLNQHPYSASVRLAETLNIQGGSAFQRALIYRTTWRIIFDHPINCLFGTGIGTYGLHYMPAQKYVLKKPAQRKYLRMANKSVYAHNEYWHYWSEVGLVGLLLLFGFGYWLLSSAHTRLREENAGVPNLMFLGMVASLVATAVHNLFTFDWHLAYSGATFYVLAGIVLAQSDPRFWTWRWRPGKKAAIVSCVLLMLVVPPFLGRVGSAVTEWKPLLFEVMGGLLVAVYFVLRLRASPDEEGPPRVVRRAEKLVAICRAEETDDGARVVVEVDPVPEPGAGAIVIESTGRKTQTEEVEPGRYEAVVPRRGTGPYRVLLDGFSPDLEEASVEVDSPEPGIDSVAGLVVVCALAVGLAQSLANDLIRDYYWRMGFLKFRMRRFEEAFLDYERAIEADPTKGEVLFDFGRALMDSGRNESAITVFNQAKATFVDPANDHNIALCYFKTGEPEKAEEHYRKALELNEIYEQSLANLAYMLIQDKRDEEAIPLLELGQSVYPNNNRFVTSLAVIRARQGRYAEAAPLFDKAMKMGENRVSVFINAGTVYYNLRQFDKAIEAFRQAVQKAPDNNLAKQKLAMAELAVWGQRAQEDPQNLESRRNYSLALLATGQIGPAATEAKNILAAYPTDPTVRFVYARALQLQGYGADALREFRRVAELAPPSDLLERARRRVQELESGEAAAPGP